MGRLVTARGREAGLSGLLLPAHLLLRELVAGELASWRVDEAGDGELLVGELLRRHIVLNVLPGQYCS